MVKTQVLACGYYWESVFAYDTAPGAYADKGYFEH